MRVVPNLPYRRYSMHSTPARRRNGNSTHARMLAVARAPIAYAHQLTYERVLQAPSGRVACVSVRQFAGAATPPLNKAVNICLWDMQAGLPRTNTGVW